MVRGPNYLEIAGYNQSAHPKVNLHQTITGKILPKRNCKENAKTSKIQQCDSTIRLHLLQNIHAQTFIMTNNFLFFTGQEVHFMSQH